MNINRRELKKEASRLVTTSKPSVILISLAYTALTVLISYLSTRALFGGALDRFAQFAMDGDYEYAAEYLAGYSPSGAAQVIDLLLTIALQVVSVGYIIFLLNTIRNTGACFGNLLDGFGFFFKIILLNILEGIFIFLWSLLFFVPGIIAAYRYSMAVYLLVDHPEMSPMDCIRESKRLMTGHKGELFKLDLSLIGWYILESIPYIGYLARIWTEPYTSMTHALYYDRLFARPSTGEADYTDYSDYNG